jgi:hypothetical protein
VWMPPVTRSADREVSGAEGSRSSADRLPVSAAHSSVKTGSSHRPAGRISASMTPLPCRLRLPGGVSEPAAAWKWEVGCAAGGGQVKRR